ncbi:MAG: hypothetical protein ABEJ96_02335, partial [Thiohalorhabdaceae bacterium]
LSGNAVTNDGEVLTEAAPQGADRYFGWASGSSNADNADSSGTLQHVIIGESGTTFQTDEEVQGLTLEAVGSGTTINYLQVLGSNDDGIEWFGGQVDASHIVINGQNDDGLDMDLGYQGNVQFALVRFASDQGNRGIESDNNSSFGAQPYSMPNLANVTILGTKGLDSKTTTAALHREGFRGEVYSSV